MKNAGWIMILISAAVVFWNVVIIKNYNEKQKSNHPIETMLTGGSNLKVRYSFTPPFTGFEVIVIGVGVIGICLVIKGSKSES